MFMIYLSHISSVLFFTPHPAPYFVVYCCGPVRLRSKHSWSLCLAWPLLRPTILFHQFPLLLLCPSYFWWTSLWCSPPSSHSFKRFSTVSPVLFYLLWRSDCYHNFNRLISITCFHMVSQCLIGATCSILISSVLVMVWIWFCWGHSMLQVKASCALQFHS